LAFIITKEIKYYLYLHIIIIKIVTVTKSYSVYIKYYSKQGEKIVVLVRILMSGSDDPGLEGRRWKGFSGGPVYAPRGREGRGPSYRPKGKKEQWEKKRRGRRWS
jgi:hypothetical protein